MGLHLRVPQSFHTSEDPLCGGPRTTLQGIPERPTMDPPLLYTLPDQRKPMQSPIDILARPGKLDFGDPSEKGSYTQETTTTHVRCPLPSRLQCVTPLVSMVWSELYRDRPVPLGVPLTVPETHLLILAPLGTVAQYKVI